METPTFTLVETTIRKRLIEARKYNTRVPKHVLVDWDTWSELLEQAPPDARVGLWEPTPKVRGCAVFVGSHARDTTPTRILEVW